jgi:Zn-dependent M16 (insulinase) family peptidase
VNLDNKDRLVQLASQARSRAQSSLISNGHAVAASELGAQTTQAGWLSSFWGGLKQYDYLTALLEEVENGGWNSVHQRLVALQACIFNKSACTVINLTSDRENLEAAKAVFDAFTSSLPAGGADAVLRNPVLGRQAKGIIVPTQVNYVGKGGNLYAASDYTFHGSGLVISKLLGTTYLWDHVRVSGGAYGGFCSFDPRSGDFKFLSYRDPNLEKTLETYDGASSFLESIHLGEDELCKAIIGCIGDVDAYMLPDAKGYQSMLRYLLEEDDEYRQKVRDEILSTKAEDFREFAKSLASLTDAGGICVVGSKEACEAAKNTYNLTLTSPLAA